MPDKSLYQRIREERCEWCRAGIGMGPNEYHLDDHGMANWRFGRRCTAPTEEQVIEEMGKRIEGALAVLEGSDPSDNLCKVIIAAMKSLRGE